MVTFLTNCGRFSINLAQSEDIGEIESARLRPANAMEINRFINQMLARPVIPDGNVQKLRLIELKPLIFHSQS